MANDRNQPPIVAFVVLIAILALAYVLSYAPFVRADTSAETLVLSWDHPLYRPVDWLTDNTPLREPLFAWADLWGVRDQFESGEYLREHPPFILFDVDVDTIMRATTPSTTKK